MCPSSAIGLDNNLDKKQIARMWGKDPVHLATAGYSMLAEKIVKRAADLRAKHLPADKAKPSHQTKSPIRQAANGLEGVSRSDLADTRWGGRDQQPAAQCSSAEESPPGRPSGRLRRTAGLQTAALKKEE